MRRLLVTTSLFLIVLALAVFFTLRQSKRATTPAFDGQGRSFSGPVGMEPALVVPRPGTEFPALADNLSRRPIEDPYGPLVSVDVRVISAETKAAIPGCEILYFDSIAASNRITPGFGRDLAQMRRFAHRSISDAEGMARLTCRVGRIPVYASTESAWGSNALEVVEGQNPVGVIECEPALVLRASVIDANLISLVGVPLRLTPPALGREVELVGLTTGSGGIAELGPVPTPERKAMTWTLRIEGAFSPDAAKEVLIEGPVLEPMQLVMPACGAVEVQVVQNDGRPFRGFAEIRLLPVDEGAFSPTELEYPESGTGKVEFGRVGLALRIRAQVRLAGVPRIFEAQFDGPLETGQTVGAEVRLEKPYPVVTGRVLDPNGVALGSKWIEIFGEGTSESRPRFWGLVATNADGQFSMALPDTFRAPTTCAMIVQHSDSGRSVGARFLHELAASESQMADIKLERAPLIVRGQVRGGVPGEADLGKVRISAPDRFSPETLCVTNSFVCTPAGTFELFGWAFDGPLHIDATLLGRAVGAIDVVKGETNAAIELRN